MRAHASRVARKALENMQCAHRLHAHAACTARCDALADGLVMAMAAPGPVAVAKAQPGTTTRSTSSITMSARVPLSQPR